MTLPDTFYCDAPAVGKPTFKDESDNYLVLRFGCGSPCWGGIFLPLYEGGKPLTLMYYYDYELDNDLVAAVDAEEKSGKFQTYINVINLKNGATEKVVVQDECDSAVPTYCLDSLSIKNRTLFYKWFPETSVNSKKGKEHSIKVKI